MNTTLLQQHSEKIAAQALDTQVDKFQCVVKDKGNLAGFDITGILALVQVIAQVISTISASCPNKANLSKSMKSPNWMQRVKFRQVVKDHCDCCGFFKLRSMSGKIADSAIGYAASLPEDQISALIEEVDSDSNWIV